MKIALVMLARGFGGAERYHVDLTTALARRGHEVLSICRRGAQAGRRLSGLKNLHCAAIGVLGAWDLLASVKIARLLRAHGSQLAHTTLGRAALLGGRAASKLGLPVLAHTHDFVDLKYFRHVDSFIPATRAQRDYLLSQGIAPDRIHRISNFSSLTPVMQPRTTNTVQTLVAHGRLAPKKGFDLLLRSFAGLTDRRIRLHIAGAGAQQHKLEGLARRLHIDDRVCFSGWQEDVRAFLLTGDLYVLPSRDEPFGIALLEAMACGLPIVATNCHGPAEILDEHSAWLCAANDEAALTAAMAAAINDPAGRRRRAQAGWRLLRQRYTTNQAVTQFERLYEDALAGRR